MENQFKEGDKVYLMSGAYDDNLFGKLATITTVYGRGDWVELKFNGDYCRYDVKTEHIAHKSNEARAASKAVIEKNALLNYIGEASARFAPSSEIWAIKSHDVVNKKAVLIKPETGETLNVRILNWNLERIEFAVDEGSERGKVIRMEKVK